MPAMPVRMVPPADLRRALQRARARESPAHAATAGVDLTALSRLGPARMRPTLRARWRCDPAPSAV